LDVCPTSNRRTGAVPQDRPHPQPTLLDAGLLVTLNSDDPPMFGTDLTNEYRVAYGLGLTAADLADLARKRCPCLVHGRRQDRTARRNRRGMYICATEGKHRTIS
jgi:adenosine deaminase